MTKVIRSDCT